MCGAPTRIGFGKIFRRNMPYGTVTTTAPCSWASARTNGGSSTMLESMAGLGDGVRDALTLYTRPLTGAYYFVPSTEALRRLFTESG